MPRLAHRRPGTGAARRANFRGVGAGGGAAPAWTPASLTSLRGWYRADLGVTLVGSDVTAWADQSGNGNHLADNGAATRPLFNASSFNGSGQPFLSFASGDYLRRATFDWGAAVSAFTVIVIGRVTTGGAVRYYFDYTPDAGVNRILSYSSAGDRLTSQTGAAASVGTSATTAASMLWYRWNGATQSVGAGETQQDSDANARAAVVDDGAFTFGASNTGASSLIGEMAEVIVMRSSITAQELTSLYAYATARYGV